MAEILLSLTIIGVVAAITLPSLTGNINERTWNTQRKALYARFSQALALMPSLNGYGTLTPAVEENAAAGVSAKDAVDNAAETFVTEGLAKVMKINNICDNQHLKDCGVPATITTLDAASTLNTSDIQTLNELNSLFDSFYHISMDTKAAAFETQNGESIIVYYNPNCVGNMEETTIHSTQKKMCANFVYDLNGNKGPNTVGKDIGFITALYPTDPIIVAPMPLTRNADTYPLTLSEANKACTAQDNESRLPNIDELTAMFYNKELLSLPYWDFLSSSIVASGDSSHVWSQLFSSGKRGPTSRTTGTGYVRCVKR